MKTTRTRNLMAAALVCALALTTTIAQAADALPSWNDGKSKQSIVGFVAKVTKKGSPDFVPPAERIATFDNDGTLWAEQPLYFQFLFAIDRVKASRCANQRASESSSVYFRPLYCWMAAVLAKWTR